MAEETEKKAPKVSLRRLMRRKRIAYEYFVAHRKQKDLCAEFNISRSQLTREIRAIRKALEGVTTEEYIEQLKLIVRLNVDTLEEQISLITNTIGVTVQEVNEYQDAKKAWRKMKKDAPTKKHKRPEYPADSVRCIAQLNREVRQIIMTETNIFSALVQSLYNEKTIHTATNIGEIIEAIAEQHIAEQTGSPIDTFGRKFPSARVTVASTVRPSGGTPESD